MAPASEGGFFICEVTMQDRDAQGESSDQQKLRDRIFQQRLWIEQLKSSAADRDTVQRAIDELQALVIRATEEMPSPKKRKKP